MVESSWNQKLGKMIRNEVETVAKEGKKIARAVAMITQIGISVLVPVFLCVYAGVWLDRKFDTGFWTIALMILGILAAFRNIYLLTRSFYAKDKAKEDAELNYLEELKKAGSDRPKELNKNKKTKKRNSQ